MAVLMEIIPNGAPLRTVGYFRRAENQLVAEEVHILVDAFQAVVRYGQ